MMARSTLRPIIALAHLTVILASIPDAESAYFGKSLGRLSELHHAVSGEVYAVDARTLYIKDFTYDGQGPAAYFFAGNTRSPGTGGFRLKDEKGSGEVIRRYRKEGVTLTLPEGKTLNNIKWFSVWCEEFEVNFGDVKIPRNFDYPRPRKIDALKGIHGISSDNIVVVDAQTLLVPNLAYDGEAPDAKFWVGRGPKPSPQGIRVADENGKEIPLRRYVDKTVVLTLPGDLTVFDIGHFGIWCEAFTVDFGHIQVPHNLNVPPSLKMLGVSPQSKLNCEVLYEDLAFEVRWAVAGDSIVLQLVSKLEDNEYMSFGISGEENRSTMVGGDVVVAWIDKETFKGYAEDYYLEAKSQCSGPSGSCPDVKLQDNSNNIRLLNAAIVNGYSIVTYQRPLKASDPLDKSIITNESQPIIWAVGPLNQRKEVSFHSEYLKSNSFIDFGRTPKWNCPKPETEQPAMKIEGNERPVKEKYQAPVETAVEYEEPTTRATRTRNQERRRGESRATVRPESNDSVAKDSEKTVTRTRQVDRRGTTTQKYEQVREVPTPAPVAKRKAWDIPAIQCYEPEDGVFYAQMGPTGGKRGYPAITGHVGWGISWYINGLLIPEINLVRGKTYTFVVEGGIDAEVPAKYHPFYITDDPVGGYEYKTDEERANVKIFAGVRKDANGLVYPTGVGRLCHWTHQGELDADDFESFGAYQRTLELKCDQGEPGVIQFTPDANTPNTVYYQCFTHRYLGWKINVLDSCDEETAASEVKPSIVSGSGAKVEDLAEVDFDTFSDLEDSPSIRVETMVKAPNSIIEDNQKFVNHTDDFSDVELSQDDFQDSKNISVNNSRSGYDEPQYGHPNSFVEAKIPIIIQSQPAFMSPPLYIHTYPEITEFKIEVTTENSYTTNPVVSETPKYTSSSTTEVPSTTTSVPPTVTDSATAETSETKETKDVKTKTTNFNKTHFVISNPHKKEPFNTAKIILPHSYQNSMRSPPYKKPTFYQFEPQLMRVPVNKPHHRPMLNGPYKFQDKPILLSAMQSKLRPQTLIFMSRPPPQMVMKTSPEPAMIYSKPSTNKPINVKISPQQLATEKEPIQITEKPNLPVLHSVPSKVHYSNKFSDFSMKPAINTGFNPESVVVEGGFKPILSTDIERRIGNEEGPELKYESEIGIIDIDTNKEEPKSGLPQSFGPVFVPSPPMENFLNKAKVKTEKQKYYSNKKRNGPLFVYKNRRNERRDIKLNDDEIAEAAERVDSFYLPPDNDRRSPLQHVVQPSNIDIPPGTVVSYDGKKVSGDSLTVKNPDAKVFLDSRASKAAELIKYVPQFEPFKGELPPLDPNFISKNIPLLYNQGFLNRDLESPSPSFVPRNDKAELAKLILIRQVNNKDNLDGRLRGKREAHHTPEHTAQQAQENVNKTAPASPNSSNSIARISFGILYTNLIVFCIFNFL